MAGSNNLLAFAALGVVLHQVYRRYEPSWQYFALSFPAALWSWRRIPPIAAATADVPVVSAASVALAGMFASMVVYRISPWHPLARYPGPLLHKISKIRVAISYLGGNDYKSRKALHDKYGPVVRVAPNEVSVNELRALTTVLGAKSFPKDRYYRARMAPGDARAVIVLSGQPHAKRRRLWNRAFGTEQVAVYTDLSREGIERLLRQMDEAIERGETVDLTKWFRYFGFDFMGQIAFGKDFGLVDKGEDPHNLVRTVTNYMACAGLNGHLWWIGRQAWIAPWLMPSLFALRGLAKKIVADRVQRPSTTIDLWHYLGYEDDSLKDTKLEPLNLANLTQEGILTVVAGSDTSTTAMASTMFFLLANPHCYQRALAEIDSVAAAGQTPWFSAESHSSLTFLNACIDESLRLVPVLPVNGPRAVPLGSGGVTIGEHFFPEGTEIYISPYVFHLDERYFSPRTTEYCPERWLEEGWNTQREAWIPFSAGPSQCVGKHVARIEIIMVLSSLMRHYTMAFPSDYSPAAFLEHVKEGFVMEVPSLPVKLTKRDLA